MSEPGRLRRIVYVPGQQPKPVAEAYRAQLWRCLLSAVGKIDPDAAAELAGRPETLLLADWNSLVYPEPRPLAEDEPWVDALLAREAADARDVAEAHSWRIRSERWLYALADHFPILMPLLPQQMRRTLEASRLYFENRRGAARKIRDLLSGILRPLLKQRADVLLIGHSLGSAIAWDTLWELSRQIVGGRIELFLTLGSPLGVRFVQRRLLGADKRGGDRFPTNIHRWINIAAVGELRAIDRYVRSDYLAMEQLGLIESIEDHSSGVYNYYRNASGLNIHSGYGYIANATSGRAVLGWWRGPAQA